MITKERFQDLLCCALEGGSNYWYEIKKFNYPEGKTKEDYEFPHLELPFIAGGSLTIGEEESDAYDKKLTIIEMQQGMKLLAEKYPKHYADFISENEDAITGDVFLQLSLFGEVIFG